MLDVATQEFKYKFNNDNNNNNESTLYSQIHGRGHGQGHGYGHHSERSSGAKTPKTPSVREATPNYNEMYLSGRSSCERTPRTARAAVTTITRHKSRSGSGNDGGDRALVPLTVISPYQQQEQQYHGHHHQPYRSSSPSRNPKKRNLSKSAHNHHWFDDDGYEEKRSPLSDYNLSPDRLPTTRERSSQKRERSNGGGNNNQHKQNTSIDEGKHLIVFEDHNKDHSRDNGADNYGSNNRGVTVASKRFFRSPNSRPPERKRAPMAVAAASMDRNGSDSSPTRRDFHESHHHHKVEDPTTEDTEDQADDEEGLDSACSVLKTGSPTGGRTNGSRGGGGGAGGRGGRGEVSPGWNSTPPGLKGELISNSQVSAVQRFVQAQAKALGKYNSHSQDLPCSLEGEAGGVQHADGDGHHHALQVIHNDHSHGVDWCSDLKKPKPSFKGLTQQKAVAAVLAFQRWRHTQLKKLFSLELKNVLEEAKEDEACLATLEKELAVKDKHLAQLRSQLARYEQQFQDQINQKHMHELLGANVEELEKECQKALERASMAEDGLRRRDAEIVRLRERLKSLDEEGVRLDSELQSNIKMLQSEKESALDEGRILLAQLTRRDEEVAQQCKEIEKLRLAVAQFSERQISQQNQIEGMKLDHQTEVQRLHEKLEQANAVRHAKETELAAYTERCSGLGQERQNLLVQLHRAVERADLASRRAEELQMKLHCTSEERAKASEDVAGEMVEHLKRLTGHMKELETSVDRTGLMGFPNAAAGSSALQKKAGLAKISTKLAQAELDALNLISNSHHHVQNYDTTPDASSDLEATKPCAGADTRNGQKSLRDREIQENNRRQVCLTLNGGKHRRRRDEKSTTAAALREDEGDTTCNISSIDRDIAFTKFKNWMAWKWRWAASAARADSLSKQLLQTERTMPPKPQFEKETESGSIVPRGSAARERAMGLVKKLESSSQFNDDVNLPDEKKIGNLVGGKHKMVPLILAAWRAFTRMSNLERKASLRNESLNKIISALPWWIRRVGERRHVERYFFHWQLLTLKATRIRATSTTTTAHDNRCTHRKRSASSVVPCASPALHARDVDRHTDAQQRQQQQQQQQQTTRATNQSGRARSPGLTSTATAAAPLLPLAHQVRDVEVQTVVTAREKEWDGKTPGTRPSPSVQGLKTAAAAPPRHLHAVRSKSEPKGPVPCPTCDIRRKLLQEQNQLTTTHGTADQPKSLANNSTFTARALRALHGSLQQELKDLNYLLSQEMEEMQQLPSKAKVDSNEGEGSEYSRLALKSVFDVCNKLAQALVDVRAQLGENQPKALTEGLGSRGETLPPSSAAAPRTSSLGGIESERSPVRTRRPEANTAIYDYFEAPSWRDHPRETSGSKAPQSAPRERLSTKTKPSSARVDGVLRTPRYASPIVRDKAARFSSPGWQQQQQEKLAVTRDPWSRFGSPTTIKQLREREARRNAPSTLRELREFRARQDQEQVLEQDQEQQQQRPVETLGGRQSPHDFNCERGGGKVEEQQQRRPSRRGNSVVRFCQDNPKAEEVVRYVQDAHAQPPKERELVEYYRADGASCSTSPQRMGSQQQQQSQPDYTTVVQILNQANTKIGEVAIHTSAAAADVDSRCTTDRGGIADLSSSARDAIRLEDQGEKIFDKQSETRPSMQQLEQQPFQRSRPPQQLAEETISKSLQPSSSIHNSWPSSALRSSAQAQSAPRERPPSRQATARSRTSELKARIMDDARFLASLRRKCIGSDYADLLRSEILRLREGRLLIEENKSCLLAEEEVGDVVTPSRELVPRSTYLANRPSWRPHYTPPPRSRN